MLQLSDSILTQDLLTNNIIIHFVSERLADCVEPLLQYTPKSSKHISRLDTSLPKCAPLFRIYIIC